MAEAWKGGENLENKQRECLLIPNMICENCLHAALARMERGTKRERERVRVASTYDANAATY